MLVRFAVLIFSDFASALQCINCGVGVYNINSSEENTNTPCDAEFLTGNLNETSFYCEGVCFTQITKTSKTLSCREQPAQLKSSVTRLKYCRSDQLYLVCENQDNCNLEHVVYQPNPVFELRIDLVNISSVSVSFKSDCQTHDYFITLNETEVSVEHSDLLSN